jgi:hypothetical protein
MLGVAMPGIAPLRATDDAAAASPPSAMPAPAPPAAPARRAVAPTPVDIVPAPAPLPEMPAPPPPRIERKGGGVSLMALGIGAAVLVVVGGIVTALLWRGGPPMTAHAQVGADGRDVLHLVCDATSCKDGTVVELDGQKATFASGAADLTLAKPLRIGDNSIQIHVDRPGMGRDELVTLPVSIAYRVRADLATMNDPHPAVTVRVDALPGTDVRVDGNPVALDAHGSGAYAIDETAQADGPADESRVVSVDVPYVVTVKGRAAEKGTVSARVSVSPLRVDAPGSRAVTDDDHVIVAGRAAKGATVTVDGTAVTVSPEGAFETTVQLPAAGERVVDVRGGTQVLTPRTVHVSLKRVASLADEARAFEGQKPIGYDAAMGDLAKATGQPIVVDGDVVEARPSGHRTIVLVDDKRGCAKGPCLARVIVGHDAAFTHGAAIHACGRVARAFTTPQGQTVPEVEADFVLSSKTAPPAQGKSGSDGPVDPLMSGRN